MDIERIQRWISPQRVLVATNLEDESVLVSEAALQGRECGGKILLVHVLEPSPLRMKFAAPDSPSPGSPLEAAWSALLHTARMIEWEGAECEPVMLEGEPARKILHLANERRVDRVIVATRSARGLDRLFGGSVAEELIGMLDVPVCVIGPQAANNPFRGSRGGQVLLTVSLHHDRLDDVQFACSLAAQRRSSLAIVHALDVNGMGKEYKKIARGIAHASIVILTSKVKGPLPEIQISIREGVPVREILDEDGCSGCEFIVMGASSPGIVSQLMGTSVIHSVIAGARCPIITLPRKQPNEKVKSLSVCGREEHRSAA